MHPPRLTIGSLLFIVAAFSIGLAALKENDLEGHRPVHADDHRAPGRRLRGMFRRGRRPTASRWRGACAIQEIDALAPGLTPWPNGP